MRTKIIIFASLLFAVAFTGCETDDATTKQEPNISNPQEPPKINGYEYVDLGLSVKWATCNIGATQPYEYGSYYSWGETKERYNYNQDTYQYFNNGAY